MLISRLKIHISRTQWYCFRIYIYIKYIYIYKSSKHPHIFLFVTQSGIKIRTSDFLLEISDIKFFKASLQNPEENYFETKLLSPAKIIFKREAKYRYIWTYKNSYNYLLMELL